MILTIIIFFLLLYWVLPMAINYNLAKKKNRTISGWMIATFFFSWWAVIFLGVMEKRENIKNNK